MDLSNNTSELINENDNPTYNLFEAKTSIPSSLESLSTESHQPSTRKRRKSVLKIKSGTKASDTVTNKKLLNQIQSLENEAGKDNVDYIDLEKRLLEVCEEILPLSLIKYIRLLLNLKKKSESSSECSATRKCRSCLGGIGNRMTSIRTLNFSPEMYSVLTFLGFNDFDINNGAICDGCVQQLQNVLIFKNQCETSQISLQNQVKTLETDQQDYTETHDDDSISHSNFDDFEYPLGLASCEIKNEPVESSEIKDELNSKIEKDELIETKNIDELKSDKRAEKKTSQKLNSNYYACSLCDNSYQLENYLIRHKYFAHFETENIYPCTIGQCGQVYNSPTDLENHKEDRHTTTCTICNKEYKTNLNLRIHRKRRHLNPHFPCSQCTRVFINKDSYERHVRHHETDPKEIRGKICDTCGKVFTTCSNFKKHFNEVHVGIKNVKCDFCDKKFVDKHRKKQHIKFTHMKYRPYKCEYCPKAFSGKEKLEDHIRVHTGEKPFICSICSRAYHQARSLQLHQQTTHNIVPEKKKLAALADP